MPTGSFFGDPGLTSRDTGGSLTGSGPASQPKSSGPAPLGGQTLSMGPQTTPNYGYGAQPTSASSPLNPNIGKWAMSALTNQLQQQQVGPSATSPYQSNLPGARSILDAFYGPQQTLLDQTLARQQSQLGQVGVNADYQSGLLRRDTDLAQRGLDVDRKAVGLDREALGIDAKLTSGQLANLDRLTAILGKQYGLQGEALKNQLAQLGIDEAKLRDMAKRQTFDLRSNLTARGAFSTIANERGTGRINRDLMYGLGGINNQRTAADIAHRGNVLGLDEKGIGYDNQRLGLNARLANIGVDTGRLGLALERIGLSEEGLANSLTDGLAAIGLDAQTSLGNLLDAIGGTNVQQAELARTILESVIGYAGLPPDVLAALMEGLGIKSGGSTAAPTGSADPTRNL